jgi:hypothetical protein
MRELAIMPSAFAREPLAELREASASKIRELLPEHFAASAAP